MKQEQVIRLAQRRATRRDDLAAQPLRVAPPREADESLEELLARIETVLTLRAA